MTLKPADMQSCKQKKKCLGGVNDGVAYDPSDPCPPDYTFDPVTCNCDQGCVGGSAPACGGASSYCLTVTPNLVGYSRGGNCNSTPTVQATLNTPVTIPGVSVNSCPVWATSPRGDCNDDPTDVNQYILLSGDGGSVLWFTGTPNGYTNDYWEGDLPTVEASCTCGLNCLFTYQYFNIELNNGLGAIDNSISMNSTETPVWDGPTSTGLTPKGNTFAYYNVTIVGCNGNPSTSPRIIYGEGNTVPPAPDLFSVTNCGSC